jgi:hypothetical protein
MILAGTKLTSVDNTNCEAITGSGGIAFYGINSADVAVGWCIDSKTGLEASFTYTNGKFTTIAFPKSNGTEATGIDDNGCVVGLYLDSSDVQHGFVKEGATYTSIDVKGGTSADAYGINNAGDIAVYALNSAGSGYESFTYNRKSKNFRSVAYPGAGTLGTIAHALNNKGSVTGTYYDSAGDVHGWLLTGGKYYSVDNPNGCKCDTRSDGINDSVVLVGRYSTTLGGASIGFKAVTQ